jgi:phage terminase Nu1 subunit (DNA packaging protein)
MPGKIVSKNELAAVFGKTPKTLTIWQHEGMPFKAGAAVGDENQYDTSECIEWYARRQSGRVDPNAEKAALLKEQAESARRKNALAKGDVISLKDARTVVQRAAYAIRQKIVTSGLSHPDKQALLVDIQSLRGVDFTQIEETDGDEETIE